MQLWLVRELTQNWLALAGQTALSVAVPVRSRLRRTMVFGESARSTLPWTRLDSLIPPTLADSATVTLRALHTAHHNCSFHELATLAVISKWMAPRKALEIGTFDGRSALAIAANLPEGGHLWTMNLPPDFGGENKDDLGVDAKLAFKVESGYRFKNSPEAARITQVFGDSTTYDFNQLLQAGGCAGGGGGPFQYIFIDGGHEESIVLKDTQSALSIVDRTSGVILWHDAPRFGVRPALKKLRGEGHPISLILGTTIAMMKFEDGKAVELPW
jgi:hypothetical protein